MFPPDLSAKSMVMDQIVALLPAPFANLALPVLLVMVAILFFLAGRGPLRRSGLLRGAKAKPAYAARPVLNAAERRVMADLERNLPDFFHTRCRLLAQVSLPEFIRSREKTDFHAISSQRVDFLIVDAGYAPLCAVEYQGAGHYGSNAHSRARTRTRDFTKRRALREAGVPLVELPDGYDRAQLRALLGDVTGRREGENHQAQGAREEAPQASHRPRRNRGAPA